MENGYTIEEQELDIKDLIANIFIKWKLVLLCMLAGMLVFGIIGVRKARNQVKEEMNTGNNQLDVVKNMLSSSEITDVESAHSLYHFYQKSIKNMRDL